MSNPENPKEGSDSFFLLVRALFAGLLTSSGLVVAAMALPASPAGAAVSCATGFSSSTIGCSAVFSYVAPTSEVPNPVETITVPTGVSALTMSVAGAQGGYGSDGSQPGAGGIETGTIPVTSGQTLSVVVGGAGETAGTVTDATGGYGGGGNALHGNGDASGGGGSFVLDSKPTLLATAGGGGGAGFNDLGNVTGGSGGGTTGGTGDDNGFGDDGGTGGTQMNVGTGGNGEFDVGQNGSGPASASTTFGVGGAGSDAGGGGGGGGYYGGGGGGGGFFDGNGAGGGGSGYMYPSATNISTGTVPIGPATAPNNGQVVFSYYPVTVSSYATLSFRMGRQQSYIIGTQTLTGSVTPSFTESGTLPIGLSFSDNKNGTLTISGMPSGNSGRFPVTVTATTGTGTATMNINVDLDQAPQFTSPNTATFTVGQHGSFTVQTTGSWPSKVTMSGGKAFPLAGLSFADNGNGTATISGTPTKVVTKRVSILAKNIVLGKIQVLTVSITQPSSA